VIVVTALPTGDTSVERAIAAGAAKILRKPFSLKALEEAVRRYLSP
jgi:DNA-binding response OmpR family regulator